MMRPIVIGHATRGHVSELAEPRRDDGLLVVENGDNAHRREASQPARIAGFELTPVMHPRACVSPHARLGACALTTARAVVGPEAQVGERVTVIAGAVVDQHARVGHFAHLGVGASLGGFDMFCGLD